MTPRGVTAAGRWQRGVFASISLAVAVLLAGCALADEFREQRQAQVAFDEGLQRYEARDYAGAVPHLQRALMLRPTFDEAEAYLAWSQYYLARYPEAALHFRQVITRQPQWAGLYDGLGWTRYREGRYHIALQAFQQALDIVATDRDALIGSAFSLFELGQYREARPLLERLTQEGKATVFWKPAPELEEARSRYAWTLFYLGEYEQARAEFTRSLVVHPEWYGLYNGIGWSQLRAGDRAGARANFERALKLQPQYGDAREGLNQAKQ